MVEMDTVGTIPRSQSTDSLTVNAFSEGGVCLKTDSIDTNESIGIGGVVVKGITTSFNVHGCQVGIVKGLGTLSSADDHISLV
mmetsp:Transcript_38149/g.110047  ORF Transcript_38149/g.110047 Transcript_38149/m.110047 type:complete len:83 (-) Transcript_38149:1112-1360(-)